MRLFIAIDIDKNNKNALRVLQRQLQSKVDIKKSDAKWVDPDNIHLTLKFLGEVKDAKVVEICNIVENVARRHKSFDLDLESVGYFGGRSAKVLWVGTGAGSDNLHQLQKELDEQLAMTGWPQDTREFNGHLTLCRIRNPKVGMKLAEITKDYKDFNKEVILESAINNLKWVLK